MYIYIYILERRDPGPSRGFHICARSRTSKNWFPIDREKCNLELAQKLGFKNGFG